MSDDDEIKSIRRRIERNIAGGVDTEFVRIAAKLLDRIAELEASRERLKSFSEDTLKLLSAAGRGNERLSKKNAELEAENARLSAKLATTADGVFVGAGEPVWTTGGAKWIVIGDEHGYCAAEPDAIEHDPSCLVIECYSTAAAALAAASKASDTPTPSETNR